MPADPATDGRDVSSALVLVTGRPSPGTREALDLLRGLLPGAVLLRTGPAAPDLVEGHELRASRTRSSWRRPLLAGAERVVPRGLRAGLATRFDPRFREGLRETDVLVVLGPGGRAVARTAHQLAAEVPVLEGTPALRRLCTEMALGTLPQLGAAPRPALPTGTLDRLLTAIAVLAGPARPQGPVRQRLRATPWLTRDTDQRDALLSVLAPVLGAEDPVLRAWTVHREVLAGDGEVPADAQRLAAAADLLLAADQVLDAEPQTAARWAALALRLRPPGHDASVGTPEEHPAPTGSRTWSLLTDPPPSVATSPDPGTTPTDAGSDGEERAQGRGAARRVLLLPAGASGPSLRALLNLSPAVRVLSPSSGDIPSSLRGDTVPDALVEARLRAGLGLPWTGYPGPTAALRDQDPEVALVDGADQRAVLASLALPRSCRLVALVRPADLDAPWLDLLDARRWDTLLVEDDDTGDRVRDRLERHDAQLPPVRVVPGLGSLRTEAPDASAREALRSTVLGDLGRLGELSASGRHDEAMSLVRHALDDAESSGRPDAALLQQAALTTTRAGEPTLRLEVLRRWAAIDPRPHVRALVTEQEGRLREFSPGWLPGDLPPTPVDPDPGRVLHLLKVSLPQRTSGYAVRSAYLLGERARGGEDVLAATALDFPGEPAPPVETVAGVRHLRLTREEVPAREGADAYLDAFARRLLAEVVRHRPALLHAHSGHRGYELALVALAVGRATGIPVVYEVRGLFEGVWTSDVERATDSELYRLRRALETRVLGEAAAVVTLSESMRQDILDRPGQGGRIDPARVVVVPNGVDDQAIAPRTPRADLRRRLGLDDAFVVGYVSNLDHPREGQEVLVEAVAQLRRRGIPVTAVLVGGGERAESLRQRAADLGVAEHVVLTGQVPHAEVGDYYALLDVFVVPRIDERAARLVTPLKPYEAMAMGLPVVVSALPALLEIVGDAERGVAFPAGDAAALAEVLDRLRQDPARRAELAAAGRSWVREHRTWRALAARYDEAYALATRGSAGGVGEPLHGGDELR
ncbi:glycosyltransferase family 4 protein [Serinicoccus marinus]|uniref:glycosyltransferase family 4 protein n=1 Tax=Serinicoccus marinus TaxID=247333 RepID=UPI0024936956|nr:glycosyltransferase family 4 protein [Serinicoccus marinus]